MPRHTSRLNFTLCRRCGFSLIELLTVIAVVAILAAIIVPVMASVRNKGDIASGTSALRNVGIAIGSYMNDHNGRYPALGANSQFVVRRWAGANDQLMAQLAAYLGAENLPDNQYVPGTASRAFLRQVDDPSRMVAYMANTWVADDLSDTSAGDLIAPFGYRKVGNDPRRAPLPGVTVVKPGSQVALIDMDDFTPNVAGTQAPGDFYLNEPIYGDVRLGLFFDWHVEAIPVDTNFYYVKLW